MPDPEMEMKRAKVAKLATERNRQARIDRGIDITTAEEALGVNELLEMILSYLPAKELFRVQRVSTRWKSAIQGSQGLQRKVFITVKNKSPKILIATNSQGQPMADARYIAGDDRDDLQVRALTPAQLQTIVGIGPTAYVDPITLVRPNHGFHCIISNHSILDRTSPFDLDHFNTWNWTVCDRLLDNKLASIRNTFATDPVCQKAEILVHTEYGREANGVRTKVVYSEFDPRGFVEASPRGLKMGDILDTISDQPGSLEIFVDSGPRCGEHVRRFGTSYGNPQTYARLDAEVRREFEVAGKPFNYKKISIQVMAMWMADKSTVELGTVEEIEAPYAPVTTTTILSW